MFWQLHVCLPQNATLNQSTYCWACALWQYRLWSFKLGNPKLVRSLHENKKNILWPWYFKKKYFLTNINRTLKLQYPKIFLTHYSLLAYSNSWKYGFRPKLNFLKIHLSTSLWFKYIWPFFIYNSQSSHTNLNIRYPQPLEYCLQQESGTDDSSIHSRLR